MSEISTQCLLFLVHEVGIEEKNKSQLPAQETLIERYVLIPQCMKEKGNETVEFFLQKGIQVLQKGQEYPSLQLAVLNRKCEIIEVLLQGYGELHYNDLNEPFLLVQGSGFAAMISQQILPPGTSINHDFYEDFPFNVIRTVQGEDYLDILLPILAYGANICVSHSGDETFLNLAVRRGDDILTRLLLDHGAIIDTEHSIIVLALLQAAKANRLPMVKLLLENGVNISSTDYAGYSSLHTAAMAGSVDIVDYLLQKGAFVNSLVKKYAFELNASPLYIATRHNHHDVMKLLLENGAFVDFVSNKGLNILQLAVQRGDPKSVALILNYGPSLNHKNNKAAFRSAVSIDNVYQGREIIDMFIDYGFFVDIGDINNSLLLHGAVLHDSYEIVKTLLTLGADVNMRLDGDDRQGQFGRTPLFIAILYKRHEVLNLLITFGADVNVSDRLGITPVSMAVRNHNKPTVDILVKFGANIHSVNHKGLAPLHYAVRYRYDNLVDFLLQKGANINVKCKKGRTPIFDKLCFGIAGVKRLVDLGARIDVMDESGETVLHQACNLCDTEVVNFLVQNGADINVKSKDGKTPIFYARTVDVAKILMNCGARIDLTDTNSGTVLHGLAIKNSDLVDFYLRNNVGVDAKNSKNETPFLIATKLGALKSMETLSKFGASIDFMYSEIIESHLHFRISTKSILHVALKSILVEYNQRQDDRDAKVLVLEKLLRYSFTNYKIINEIHIFNLVREIKAYPHPHVAYSMRDLLNSNHFERVAKILARHSIEVSATGFAVRINGLRSVPGCKIIFKGNYAKDCELEVSNLKNENICDTEVTFFDILMNCEIKNSCVARNARLREVLTSDVWKEKFPIYGKYIEHHIQKALLRRDLSNECIKALVILFPKLPRLPAELAENIVNYLNIQEMIILTDVCFPRQ